MTKETELKNCPFCAGENVQVSSLDFVRCCDCHARGPDKYGVQECVNAWNNRVGE